MVNVPAPTNNQNSLDDLLQEMSSTIAVNHVGKTLVGYQKRRKEDEEFVEKAKAAINKTIMEEVQEIVDSTEYMHSIDSENNVRRFIHADKFKQLLAKKYGRADNE